jgi:hypothetical protein
LGYKPSVCIVHAVEVADAPVLLAACPNESAFRVNSKTTDLHRHAPLAAAAIPRSIFFVFFLDIRAVA